MTWQDLDGVGVTARPSPLESRRFAVSMGRVVVGHRTGWDEAVADDLVAACARSEEILVARWPAHLPEVPAVLADSGRVIIPADNLVYWEAPTRAVVAAAAWHDERVDVVGCHAISADELDSLVASTFEGYVNHYSVNPRLGGALALEGYVEWVERIADSTPEAVVVLRADGSGVGLSASHEDPEGAFIEILLAGLVPGARNRGWYATLLAYVAGRAEDAGVDRVVISTQAGNVSAQRAWIRSGFKPFACFATAHAVSSSRGVEARAPSDLGRG